MLLPCHVRIFEWIYNLQFPLCQGTPCPKQVQYLKRRGGRTLILTNLDSPVTEVFPHHWLYLFDFSHLQEEMGGQSWTKRALSPSSSYENSNPSIFFKQRCCLLEYFLWWEFQQYWTIFGGVTQKGPFHRCWVDTKTLRTFNLTTTNAILMKLTMIMYLHESVNRSFWVNVYEFIDSI